MRGGRGNYERSLKSCVCVGGSTESYLKSKQCLECLAGGEMIGIL